MEDVSDEGSGRERGREEKREEEKEKRENKGWFRVFKHFILVG